MQCINLAGNWQLSRDGEPPIPGRLPGSTYLDFMAAGMPDPFWGTNETNASELAHHNFTYSRDFELSADFLTAAHVDLVARGVDTLCTIVLNGAVLCKTDNINRTWRLDAKSLARTGKNTIELQFENPFPYMDTRQAEEPLFSWGDYGKGAGYLRKTPCHFGWDWGPVLPPAGLIGGIELQRYEARIEDLRIRQHHSAGGVVLELTAGLAPEDNLTAACVVRLAAPDGKTVTHGMQAEGARLCCRFPVEQPRLWWCNGLGEQPLYALTVELYVNGSVADTQRRQIGLRTLELDTAPDAHGAQFRFTLNGVPIFAKGANWIPADSFITRVTREDIDFYVGSARRANMNMLRVWGGGMYESEDFYDACDRNGILVWQDFIFSCSAYPLHDRAFLDNVHAEVIDNVRRVRHRACLALWCGNNENELVAKEWKKSSRAERTNLPFYHNTLRAWVEELDGVTPYWPGSPSAGAIDQKAQRMREGEIRGDSHLWQVWHGMMPIEAFRKSPTRFCSEYGMESMPSMHTVRTFTDHPTPSLFDPVMQLHQKSPGGNGKMLYYLLAKYRNPASFEDFIYLSQLVQANAVRFAADCWRRGIGRQNGALFWQLNDCWPVASWAGIDYGKQWKAVIYMARHFNKMLCISNDYYDDRAELHVVNELPDDFTGVLQWELHGFDGEQISEGFSPVSVPAVGAARVAVVDYVENLRGRNKRDAALTARLLRGGEVLDEKHWLLVPDKDARLPHAALRRDCAEKDGAAQVTLHSPVYARYVYLEAEGVTAPWSDNFFDIPAGKSVTVTVPLPPGMDVEQLQQGLRIKTLADVEPKNGRLKDRLLQFAMLMQKRNFPTWLAYKLFYKYL